MLRGRRFLPGMTTAGAVDRASLLASRGGSVASRGSGIVGEADGLAFGEGVGRVQDDIVGGGEAGGDLERGAVVLADGDVLQVNVAVAHDAYLGALGTEEQRIGGNGKQLGGLGKLEVNESIGPGQEFVLS